VKLLAATGWVIRQHCLSSWDSIQAGSTVQAKCVVGELLQPSAAHMRVHIIMDSLVLLLLLMCGM
jgi:hypothetical protein